MGNLDQKTGPIESAPPTNGDILGIASLDIKYNPLDLKDLDKEEIENIQADIQSELKNPGVDLTQRIQTILELAGIKSTLAKDTKSSSVTGAEETGKKGYERSSISSSVTGAEETGKKGYESIKDSIEQANDAIKALAPGLVESLTKDIKLADLTEQQKDLLATQQGTTPEKIDLTSPTTQSLIEVFAIDKNRDQIRESAIKGGKSSQEVHDIFTTWGMKMNEYQIPVSGSIDSSLKGIPKKIAEPVKSTYQEIVGDKTPPTVTRTGDRLTFSDPRNERYSYEIDMSKQPPRLAKTLSGLSISRDISPVLETPEQKEKKTIEKSIGNQTKGLKENPYIGALLGVDYNELLTQAEKSKNPKEQLYYSYQGLQKKSYAITKLIEQYDGSGEQAESNAMKKALIQVKSQEKEILATATAYEVLLKKERNNPTISTVDTFDTDAQDNLSWLVENRFDRMGPNANNALQKIIDSINIDEPSSTIDLTRAMSQRDRERLITALEKLGGTPDVLTNGDKLPVFQQKITMAASKNLADPNSIRGLLTKPETPSSIQ